MILFLTTFPPPFLFAFGSSLGCYHSLYAVKKENMTIPFRHRPQKEKSYRQSPVQKILYGALAAMWETISFFIIKSSIDYFKCLSESLHLILSAAFHNDFITAFDTSRNNI